MIYVVGHRGAAGVRPENTLAGFEYAIDLGVDLVECDVHLTRDGQLVVMHDARVERTTDGCGAIRELDFAAVRRLDAGNGQQVPTLDEVLATVQGRVGLLCELKGEGVVEAAVAAVAARGMEAEVTFTSFHLDRIARVRDLGGHYRLGAIFMEPNRADIAAAAALQVAGIGIHYRNLNLRLVAEVHAAGIDVRAWNPDTLEAQRAMIGLGVDGVGTNRPDILMDYLVGRT